MGRSASMSDRISFSDLSCADVSEKGRREAECVEHALVARQRRRAAGLTPLPAPREDEHLHHEQLVEGEAPPRVRLALVVLRVVRLPDGLREGQEACPASHRLRQRVFEEVAPAVQRRLYQAPEVARRQPVSERIDRYQAAGVDHVLPALQRLVLRRLHDRRVAKDGHPTAERQSRARPEALWRGAAG